MQEATLNVAIGNAPALRVYRRLGFVDRAQVEDYYGPVRQQTTSTAVGSCKPAMAGLLAPCMYCRLGRMGSGRGSQRPGAEC